MGKKTFLRGGSTPRDEPCLNMLENITIFFSAVLFRFKLNIFHYELMNEVCIVFFPCLYIKARKSMCNFH